ncbi:hypothetical protein Ccrd_023566, partial [Cynara cardunculus var. scolymus]
MEKNLSIDGGEEGREQWRRTYRSMEEKRVVSNGEEPVDRWRRRGPLDRWRRDVRLGLSIDGGGEMWRGVSWRRTISQGR